MQHMRMCDPQRIKGWWFLPGTPDERVPGILTWSQESGADLELIGGLSGTPKYEQVKEGVWQADEMVSDMPPGTIYGETDAGAPLTLWNAERGNYKVSFRHEIREEFWHSPLVCVGAHVPSAHDPAFRAATVAFDDLYYLTGDGRFCTPQWAQIEGVTRPNEQLEDGTLLMPYLVPVVGGRKAGLFSGSTGDTEYYIDTYATQPPVTPATEAMPDLKLDMMTERRRGGQRLELSIRAQVRVRPVPESNRCSVTDLLDKLSPLSGLLRLATFAGSGVESMHGDTLDGDEVSFLCHLGQLSAPDSPTESGGVVFTLDEVPLDHFLQTLQAMTSTAQARYAWNAFVGLIGHSPRMVEEHISQVLAAAEGFHKWCLQGGSKTLKDRLVLLHDSLPADVRGRLKVDVSRWADWAVWARNHVAHGGADKHRDVADFYQLKVIADSVRLITYLVALQKFGVPEDKVSEAIANHPRIRVLAHRCAQIADLPMP